MQILTALLLGIVLNSQSVSQYARKSGLHKNENFMIRLKKYRFPKNIRSAEIEERNEVIFRCELRFLDRIIDKEIIRCYQMKGLPHYLVEEQVNYDEDSMR